MAKGFAGTVFLTTDDVTADYEDAQGPRRRVHRGARGAPVRDRLPGFRDPSGNRFRLTQVTPL